MSASSSDSEESDVIGVREHLVDRATSSQGEALRLDACPACDKDFFGHSTAIYGFVSAEDLSPRVIAILIAHHFIEHEPEDFGLDADPGDHEHTSHTDIYLDCVEEEVGE